MCTSLGVNPLTGLMDLLEASSPCGWWPSQSSCRSFDDHSEPLGRYMVNALDAAVAVSVRGACCDFAHACRAPFKWQETASSRI